MLGQKKKEKSFTKTVSEELVLVKMNGGNLMDKDPFKKVYKAIRTSKKRQRLRALRHAAIGLKACGWIKAFKYLIDTTIKNIEGDISIDETEL